MLLEGTIPPTTRKEHIMKFKLWLDCDGVCADFDTHFENLAGEPSRGYEDKHGTKAFWKVVMSDPQFFVNLPLMPNIERLINAVRHTEPTILTGVPQGSWASPQKHLWKHNHRDIFHGIDMITCLSRDKSLYMIPDVVNIIVDDWPKHQTTWEERGGTWVMHTSVEDSLEQLAKLGVL